MILRCLIVIAFLAVCAAAVWHLSRTSVQIEGDAVLARTSVQTEGDAASARAGVRKEADITAAPETDRAAVEEAVYG